MASLETAGHQERREQQRTALDTLPVADISKRPESVATALQQSQKANEVAGRIVGTERAGQIQKDNPHAKHPDTLSKEPEITNIQQTLYSGFGIDKNTDANNAIKKFGKGVIDGLLVGNGEVIMMIKNEGVDKFLSILKEQLGSLEGWKKIAEALGTSVWELFTGDAYERGKSIAELGLITTGAGAVGSLAKYAGKTAIRTSVKVGSETVVHSAVNRTLYAAGRTAEVVGTGLQLPAKGVKKVAEGAGKAVGVVSEKTGVSEALRTGARVGSEAYERSGAKKVVDGTRQAIKSTIDTGIATIGATEAVQALKGKIGEVIDKRMQAKYEKLEAEGKLIPKERLDIDMYSPTQLKGLQERLGLPPSATKEEIEKMFQLRLYEAMEQYEKQGKKNLERVGMDIMEQMRRRGIEDPKKVILDEIKAVKEAYARGDIKILRVDDFHPNIPMEGFRSPYQLGDGILKPKQYAGKRENIDKSMGIYGLDPKYATVLVSKDELDIMIKAYLEKNKNGIPTVSVFDMKTVQGKSGITFYDSMLGGVLDKGTKYIFPVEDIFTVRALKNIEKDYTEVKKIAVGDFGALRTEALNKVHTKWETEMYSKMTNFMELQMFGKVGPPMEHYIGTDTATVFKK